MKQYTPVILKMTISEGKVLLKLIDRETEYTAFQIINRGLSFFFFAFSKIMVWMVIDFPFFFCWAVFFTACGLSLFSANGSCLLEQDGP